MVRRIGAYERVMRAANYCIEKGYPLSICVVPTNENLVDGDFESIVRFACENKIRLNCNLPAPVGELEDDPSILPEKSLENSSILTEESLEILRTKYFPLENFLPDFKIFSTDRVWCPMGEGFVYIMPDGDVGPCTFTQISFGNLLHEDLVPIVSRMRDSEMLQTLERRDQCPISMDRGFIKKVTLAKDMDSENFPPRWENVKSLWSQPEAGGE